MTQPDAGESPGVTRLREAWVAFSKTHAYHEVASLREAFTEGFRAALALPELQRALGTQGEPEPMANSQLAQAWSELRRVRDTATSAERVALESLFSEAGELSREVARLRAAPAPATPAVQAVEIVREYQRAAERLGNTIAAVTAHQIGNAIERECKSATPAGPELVCQVCGAQMVCDDCADANDTELHDTLRASLAQQGPHRLLGAPAGDTQPAVPKAE